MNPSKPDEPPAISRLKNFFCPGVQIGILFKNEYLRLEVDVRNLGKPGTLDEISAFPLKPTFAVEEERSICLLWRLRNPENGEPANGEYRQLVRSKLERRKGLVGELSSPDAAYELRDLETAFLNSGFLQKKPSPREESAAGQGSPGKEDQGIQPGREDLPAEKAGTPGGKSKVVQNDDDVDSLGDGWIKIHRKIEKSAVFQNEGLLKVWVWCLIKANYEDKWIPVKTGRGETPVLVKRGQFIFGRKTAAKDLKMEESTVYKRMKKLENLQNLTIQSNTHYSIVTVLNYELYQSTPEEEGTDKVTPKEQPSNTTKNKKEKLSCPNCPPATSDQQDPQKPKRPVGKRKPEYSEDSTPYKLAKYLWKLIQENFPKTKSPDLQKWAWQIDLMIRIDKRDPDDIGQVIAWAQKDSFWRSNILSTEKLRKQFDTIQARMGGLK